MRQYTLTIDDPMGEVYPQRRISRDGRKFSLKVFGINQTALKKLGSIDNECGLSFLNFSFDDETICDVGYLNVFNVNGRSLLALWRQILGEDKPCAN